MTTIELTDGYEVMARPKLQLMTEDQIRQIHEASLEVLERTGVKVLLPEALQLLEEAGADVRDNNSVKIPSWLVEKCLRCAPKRITAFDRNGEPAMRMQGNNVHYGLGTDTKWVIDVDTGERRLPRADEAEAAARGPKGFGYPWGNDWEDGICNSHEAGLGGTSAVGIFPRDCSPFGVMAMVFAHGVSNYGTAYRHRAKMLPLLIAATAPLGLRGENPTMASPYALQKIQGRVFRGRSYRMVRPRLRGCKRT